MQSTSTSSSIFASLRNRELSCRKVPNRPSLGNMTSDGACLGSGVLVVETNGESAPPLAIAFGKTQEKSHLLAVADEEGFISIFNTHCKLPSLINSRISSTDARRELWMAHSNAVFDVCWVKDDRHMLTGSGDQTVRLWDVEGRAGLGVMKGHSGTIKSLSVHPTQPDVFVSGSRDGNIAIWDVRGNFSYNSDDERCFQPVSMIKDAHVVKSLKRTRGGLKATTKSVTAVIYLKDERILATAGAADGVVKYWDTRQLKTPVTQTPTQDPSSTDYKDKRVHGISGLALHPSGTYLISSCTDSRIHLYDVNNPGRGSLWTYQGHILGSFYIKATFSPDGTHILSGSSDGNLYIWQVDAPGAEPTTLKGHGGEVTAVDWCPSDFCKVATCSDDFTVRVWRTLESSFRQVNPCPSSAMRRRITATPCSDVWGSTHTATIDHTAASPCYRLTSKAIHNEIDESMNQQQVSQSVEESLPSNTPQTRSHIEQSPAPRSSSARLFETTPVTQEKTRNVNSPASILNPPSSSKRRKTINDYFGQ